MDIFRQLALLTDERAKVVARIAAENQLVQLRTDAHP
jgi:hypothetical protein